MFEIAGERLPTAVVDLDAFDRNVARMADIARASGKSLRIATKSIRVPALISRVLAAGPPFRGLMCFSIEEAAFLASHGHDDFLIAYPTLQHSDLRALRELHEDGKRVSLVVDCPDHLRVLAEAMRGCGREFPVVVEVDASLRLAGGALHLGVKRSPLRSIEDLSSFLDAARSFAGIRVAGAMVYEAQVAGLGDRNPFKPLLNPISRLIRSISIRRVARLRRSIAELFAARGLELEIFNGGGTGSLHFAAREPALTELTAGSGLLCSHLFDYYSNLDFEPSAFFALQAVRSPDPGYVTCLGGGYIASGEPGWDKVPLPCWPEGSSLTSFEAAGEVQTPVRVGSDVALGSPILFRHAKAGELAERFNEYLLVSKGRIVDRAKTYRGHGSCFL